MACFLQPQKLVAVYKNINKSSVLRTFQEPKQDADAKKKLDDAKKKAEDAKKKLEDDAKKIAADEAKKKQEDDAKKITDDAKKAEGKGKFLDIFKFRKKREKRYEDMMVVVATRLFEKNPAFFIKLTDSLSNASSKTQDSTLYKALQLSINKLFADISHIDSLKNNKQQPQAELAIDDLVDKVFDQVKQALDKEQLSGAQEGQSERLKQIRSLLANGNKTDTIKLNDSTLKVFTVTLKKRAELFGYHRVWVKDGSANYKFKLISTFAFYGYEVDGKTGLAKTMHDWETSKAITTAQNAGCKIALVVVCKGADNVAQFLKNTKAQKKMAAEVVNALKQRNANAVNIMFESLTEKDRDRFVYFVDFFSKLLAAENADYSLTIALPAIDRKNAYDVTALEPFVSKFIIDFTKKDGRGPIAPLKGSENSIQESLDRYLNQNVPADKIIACLPYYGLLCNEDSDAETEYMAYSQIKSDLPGQKPVYDKEFATAYIDNIIGPHGAIQKLWYDDDVTLNAKYDYILKNDIKGIGIWSLGYDNGHEELWNVLMDKLFALDTINVKLIHTKHPQNTFWLKVQHELMMYKLMLTKPCEVNLSEYHSDELIKYVMWFFIIVLVLVAIFYGYKLKYEGDDWTWKKVVLRLLIVLTVVMFLSVFLYFFLTKDIPFIGITDNDKECDPLPFGRIITIICIGFAFGLLVMRLLVMPLSKKEEKP